MSDPVTDHVRPISELLEQARAACEELEITARVFKGTTLDDLTAEAASVLTASGGEPAAVIAYSGSDFGDHPRRVSEIDIVILAAKTRVNTATADILAKARLVAAALDDTITQDTDGSYPVTDRWKLQSEQMLDFTKAKAAAAVILAFDVEDY